MASLDPFLMLLDVCTHPSKGCVSEAWASQSVHGAWHGYVAAQGVSE